MNDVLTDKNKVINLNLLFRTTFLNVNKHPSMLLHIFTEAITNKPYQSLSHQRTQRLSAMPSTGQSTQSKSHYFQLILGILSRICFRNARREIYSSRFNIPASQNYFATRTYLRQNILGWHIFFKNAQIASPLLATHCPNSQAVTKLSTWQE